ncbi:MAG: hypothetical protein D6699_03630 [Aquificota bacterium]|nr:MAG: hypothetical protein D6699_03630 [Aquificota bacterium]
MRRFLWLSLPFVLSMAEPVANKNLRLELVDKDGVRHELTGLLCGGRDYLRVKEGAVSYAVPFSSVKSVQTLKHEDNLLKLRVELKGQGVKELYVPADTFCKANSKLGQASFYLRDVRSILFREEDKR